MGYQRRISIFRDERSQAVRIPKEYELPGKEATIRRDGRRLVIEPVGRKPNLLEVLAAMQPSAEPFPDMDDPFPEPVEP